MKAQYKTAQSSAKARGKKKRAPRASSPPARRKNRFTPAELVEFRQILLRKRRELIGDAVTLRNEAGRNGDSGAGGRASPMPIHIAELASDAWEQELTFGFIENKQSLLREIEDALQRIEDGTYGICEATKKRITKARLRAIPWARHCFEYAKRLEAGLA